MEIAILDILKKAIEKEASDVYIVAGGPACLKINGKIEQYGSERLTDLDTKRLVEELYSYNTVGNIHKLLKDGDDDFSISVKDL